MPRPLTRSLPIAALLGTVLLAGPATGTAAAAKHTPCPTTGTTLAKDVSPNLRVWREGTTLKACTRRAGGRRYVRTLGVWSTDTRIATGTGTVAWTTRGQTDGGELVDAVTTADVRTGKRWLKTVRAIPAAGSSTPAADDRVLRLVTSDTATAWVTARGVVAAAVAALDDEPTSLFGEGRPSVEPFHVGCRFVLGDAGPADAASVAKRLRLTVGGDGDECGGVDEFRVAVPSFGTQPDLVFVYLTRDWTSDRCD